MRRSLAAFARRHRRLTGLLFAALLAVGYLGALRPVRVAFAQRVALPLFERVDTERSARFDLVVRPGGGVIYAFPTGTVGRSRTGDELDALARWAPPVGALFVLPAMFLIAAFPFRRHWLTLLGYHLGVGVVALGTFALGLGWAEWAFALYTFSQTYVLETVSLAIPLLLWLAGRAEDGAEAEAQPVAAEASA